MFSYFLYICLEKSNRSKINRAKNGLMHTFVSKPSKCHNLPVELVTKGCQKGVTTPSQLENMNEVKDYAIKVFDSLGGVPLPALIDNCDESTVYRCIETGQLGKHPTNKDWYIWSGV